MPENIGIEYRCYIRLILQILSGGLALFGLFAIYLGVRFLILEVSEENYEPYFFDIWFFILFGLYLSYVFYKMIFKFSVKSIKHFVFALIFLSYGLLMKFWEGFLFILGTNKMLQEVLAGLIPIMVAVFLYIIISRKLVDIFNQQNYTKGIK